VNGMRKTEHAVGAFNNLRVSKNCNFSKLSLDVYELRN